jgi:uncharacterized protein (TIGR00730 family)
MYAEAAEALGRLLVKRGMGLVYGGGKVGLMGTIADAVLAGGGEVVGVIPRALVLKEVAHEKLSELRIVDSMHERKALMADLADGFIALPGGYGTLDEFCEILTWAQLGLHQKPCGVLNVGGYYDHFIQLLDHAVQEEFLKRAHRAILLTERDGETLLDAMLHYRVRAVDKWIKRSET